MRALAPRARAHRPSTRRAGARRERAASRVARASDAATPNAVAVARVALFGYGAAEIPRVRELVDALRAAVEDSGVELGEIETRGVRASEMTSSVRGTYAVSYTHLRAHET